MQQLREFLDFDSQSQCSDPMNVTAPMDIDYCATSDSHGPGPCGPCGESMLIHKTPPQTTPHNLFYQSLFNSKMPVHFDFGTSLSSNTNSSYSVTGVPFSNTSALGMPLSTMSRASTPPFTMPPFLCSTSKLESPLPDSNDSTLQSVVCSSHSSTSKSNLCEVTDLSSMRNSQEKISMMEKNIFEKMPPRISLRKQKEVNLQNHEKTIAAAKIMVEKAQKDLAATATAAAVPETAAALSKAENTLPLGSVLHKKKVSFDRINDNSINDNRVNDYRNTADPLSSKRAALDYIPLIDANSTTTTDISSIFAPTKTSLIVIPNRKPTIKEKENLEKMSIPAQQQQPSQLTSGSLAVTVAATSSVAPNPNPSITPITSVTPVAPITTTSVSNPLTDAQTDQLLECFRVLCSLSKHQKIITWPDELRIAVSGNSFGSAFWRTMSSQSRGTNFMHLTKLFQRSFLKIEYEIEQRCEFVRSLIRRNIDLPVKELITKHANLGVENQEFFDKLITGDAITKSSAAVSIDLSKCISPKELRDIVQNLRNIVNICKGMRDASLGLEQLKQHESYKTDEPFVSQITGLQRNIDKCINDARIGLEYVTTITH